MPQNNWNSGAKLMCSIASDVSNQEKTLRMLAYHKNWKLSTTGRSKLFLQVNSQDMIEEFVEYATMITGSNDALLTLVGDIDLEGYINSQVN